MENKKELKLEIGEFEKQPVYYDRTAADNGIVGIIGISGGGKSTQMTKMSVGLAKAGKCVIAIDIHDTFSDEHIHPKLVDKFRAVTKNIEVKEQGIPFPLFEKMQFPEGGEETDGDVISSVTEMLTRAFRLGSNQKRTLKWAVKTVYKKGLYKKFGIKAIQQVLEMVDEPNAFDVSEKISPITENNVFVDGEIPFEKGKVNCIRLGKLSFETQISVAEALLSLIWRKSNMLKAPDEEIYILVDECHNFNMSKATGVLPKLIAEGRKFGLNLILSTQTLTDDKTQFKLLAQSSLLLFCKVSKGEMREVAKLLDSKNALDWKYTLMQMATGDMIAKGPLAIGDGETRNGCFVMDVRIPEGGENHEGE